MRVGDIVELTEEFVTVDFCHFGDSKVVMIIEAPNEVGNIRVLLPSGSIRWVHCSDISYPVKRRSYLKQ